MKKCESLRQQRTERMKERRSMDCIGLDSREFLRRQALHYDDKIGGAWSAVDPTVRFLGGLAEGKRILELGVGTGRIALPLARLLGVRVVGVDNSPEMLTELARKDPDSMVEAVEADMVDVELHGRFDLIYCVFNTLYAITEQERQLRAIRNAARHLARGGHLVVETQTIGFSEFVKNRLITPLSIGEEATELVVIMHDPTRQLLVRQTISSGLVPASPLRMRYVLPAELDLMARIAGLQRVERFGGWSGETFTAAEEAPCISVFRSGGNRPSGE
jgi:SAM-dependent methyltransferase